jgi:vacuolar-type H+-ATPase subunit H
LSAPDTGGGGDLERSASEAIERIQQIIESAERIAGQIQASAREEARHRVEGARHDADRLTLERVTLISQLTDSLIERARDVERKSDDLIGALEAAVSDVAAQPAAAATAVRQAPAPEQPAARPPAAEPGAALDAALLRATQMALAGSDRGEIERVLSTEYGIREPGPILDRILGDRF